MLTMLSDLTRAVNELREEVRAIRRPCCNESVDAGVLPLDLPLHNIEELNNAEAALQSQEANKAMVRRFALIGGTTLEVRVRHVMAYAITNELASVLNWAGKKTKDQTEQKRAFKDTALCRCIFETWLEPSVPDCAITPDGFTVYRGDRTKDSGKKRGGVVCFMVNSLWARDVCILKTYCSQSLELLTINPGEPMGSEPTPLVF
ncbi:uncharacterized protein LOC120715734 [Simochromis diagramma]|uniref:uncharacterized protein LOC120715734 n=1 Tax=Simochromis diagramma TaxID=43689 RepID=UPI001A7EB8FB|nr:uncharacterized protein LOC120715734 [Simochromis diagramma]